MKDNDILIRQVIFDLEIESEEAFQSYADIINNFTRNNCPTTMNLKGYLLGRLS